MSAWHKKFPIEKMNMKWIEMRNGMNVDEMRIYGSCMLMWNERMQMWYGINEKVKNLRNDKVICAYEKYGMHRHVMKHIFEEEKREMKSNCDMWNDKWYAYGMYEYDMNTYVFGNMEWWNLWNEK